MEKSVSFGSRFLPFLLVVAGLSLFGLQATAQQMQADPNDSMEARLDEVARVQQEIQDIGERLEAIEQSAVEANPELREQQAQFREKLIQTMRENGYEVQDNIERLQELELQLGDQALAPERRFELMEEFRERVVTLQQAEQEAMQNEEVLEARHDLAASMLMAMKQQDSTTEALIQRMQQAHERLQELLPLPGAPMEAP